MAAGAATMPRVPRKKPLRPSTPTRGFIVLVKFSPSESPEASSQNPAAATAADPTACATRPAVNPRLAVATTVPSPRTPKPATISAPVTRRQLYRREVSAWIDRKERAVHGHEPFRGCRTAGPDGLRRERHDPLQAIEIKERAVNRDDRRLRWSESVALPSAGAALPFVEFRVVEAAL